MTEHSEHSQHPWFAHYDAGVPRSLGHYPERTLADYIHDTATERPEHPAFIFKGRSFTYADLERTANAFATALQKLGVKRGDRVAAMLPNCPQFFIVELAAWKLGASLAPLNPIYTEEELVSPLQTGEPEVVVALTPFYERLKAVQSRTTVRHVITTNIKEYFPTLLRWVFTVAVEKKAGHRITRRDGDPALADLLAANDGKAPTGEGARPDDIALLLMSGGTTGTPKCVPGKHRDLVTSGLQLQTWVADALPAWTGKFMLPLPMFHSYGACAAQSVAFIGHNPIVLVPNPRDIPDLLKTLAQTRPQVFAGVPTLYNTLLNRPEVKAGKVDFSCLRVCVSGAAPLMAETKKRFEAVSGARIIEAYSLTESLIAATASPVRGMSKIGSVGVPLPDVNVCIADVDDPAKLMPTSEVGEILIAARQLMDGYWRNPEESALMLWADAAGTRWLRTGDLGYMDSDGYLFIVDRKKDLIKPNGFQVWPREIEEVIATHPAVAEVGVRGFPDMARGEIAVAFVVLRPGASATAEELREHAKAHLAHYKVPGKVVFRSELPKSLIGKVLRRMLTLDEESPTA
jgi:long-chain acyl-CoA synthetase